MLSFSVNSNVLCDVPAQLRYYIEHNTEYGETNKLLEDLGELYLRIADPSMKKQVSQDVKVKGYMKKRVWTRDAHKVKYEVPIVMNDELDDDTGAKEGVSENVLKYVEENLDRIADSDELRESIAQLYEMADIIEIEQDVNLITVMLQAVKGNLTSINLLKKIKDQYEGLSDLLFTIMSQEGWSNLLCSD